jgi:hypothetical protein
MPSGTSGGAGLVQGPGHDVLVRLPADGEHPRRARTTGDLVDLLLTLWRLLQRLLIVAGTVVALTIFTTGTWWLLEHSCMPHTETGHASSYWSSEPLARCWLAWFTCRRGRPCSVADNGSLQRAVSAARHQRATGHPRRGRRAPQARTSAWPGPRHIDGPSMRNDHPGAAAGRCRGSLPATLKPQDPGRSQPSREVAWPVPRARGCDRRARLSDPGTARSCAHMHGSARSGARSAITLVACDVAGYSWNRLGAWRLGLPSTA